jgi:hypothetical protein
LGEELAFRVEQVLINQDGADILASRVHWLDETIERNADTCLPRSPRDKIRRSARPKILLCDFWLAAEDA